MFMKQFLIYFILFSGFYMLGGKILAQTNADLEDKLILDKTEYLLCNGSNDGEDVSFGNMSDFSAFLKDSFVVDWGDGSKEQPWPNDSLFLSHKYVKYGKMKLVLKAKSLAGDDVKKEFSVMRFEKPIVAIKEGESGVSCMGTVTEIRILDYEKHSSVTKYSIQYGDGQSDELTQQEIVDCSGILSHTYYTAPCPLIVELKVLGECGEELPYVTTFQTGVVVPATPKFGFETDVFCSDIPVRVINQTLGGTNATCFDNTQYRWNFGSGATPRLSTDKNPPDVVFTPGNHTITLETTNGLECSKRSISKMIYVKESPVADFTITTNEICSGEVIHFTNTSSGEDMQYQWTVDGVPNNNWEFVSPDVANSEHVKIKFNDYGEFTVNLMVTNGCPYSEKEAIITVKKDPEVLSFNLPDSICPALHDEFYELDLSNYVSYSWNGNAEQAEWDIQPIGSSGQVDYLPSFGSNSIYPRVKLKKGSSYQLTVKLPAVVVNGVECGDPAKRTVTKKLKINDPEIVQDITPTPGVVDGKISICDGQSVAFVNHSSGENLKHVWSVVPVSTSSYDPNWSIEYVNGSAESPEPEIKFKGYGDFIVQDLLTVACNSVPVTFQVHVAKDPSIMFFDLPDAICPETSLDMNYFIEYNWYNNPQVVQWEFDPSGNEIMEPGYNTASLKPIFSFKKLDSSKSYDVTVSLVSVGCPTSGENLTMKEHVRVKGSALVSTVTANPASLVTCEGEEPIVFTNVANDPEGELRYVWNIDRPEDCSFVGPDNAPRASIRFNKWGDYQLVAEVQAACDTMKKVFPITVKKNPEVILRDTMICPGRVELKNFVEYYWYNATDRTVSWDIFLKDGGGVDDFSYEDGTGPVSDYPVIQLNKKGDYQVKVSIPSAGCSLEIDGLIGEKDYHVYDTTIYGTIIMEGMGDVTNPGDICEGESVTFENTTYAEEIVEWYWRVEGPESGYEFSGGGKTFDGKSPVITFSIYGEYIVHVKVSGKCNSKNWSFPVTVRGIPEVNLTEHMKRRCEGDEVDMSTYVTYPDAQNGNKNNLLTYEWTVEADRTLAVLPIISAPDADITKIVFPEPARYTVKLKAGVKCAENGIIERESVIDVISGDLKAVFTVGKDSVGCTNDPGGYIISVNNNSKGDSLTHNWSVMPEIGWNWKDGRDDSEAPGVQVTEEGEYEIKLHITNGCSSDDSIFRIKAFAIPSITVTDIANECETFHFSGKDRVLVDEHNDKLLSAIWTITDNPGYPSEGFSLKNGTELNSFFPDIDFNTCDYTVKVEYRNRCQTPGEATFQVKVDKFIPIQPLDDDAICELAGARELVALPEGGYWTLKEAAMPGGEKILYSKEGKYYFEPAFTAYEEKDIELVYQFQHLSCIARDTMNMHVWPLPYVDAGDPLEMCLNHEPVLLVGKDSVANGNWQSNRGQWTLGADALEQHYFKAVTPGDFRLQYEYTYEYSDGTGCRNIDTTIMTVRELPNTGFAVNDKNCINLPVLFTPDSPANNQFEWSFGDNTTGQSEDTITHLYHDYGFREIICRAENQYHCKDTSEPKQIEIVNLPPPAFFDVDTLNGCAPFEVNITVDRSVYADDHNYLSFHWDYGEETVTDTLGPIVPKFYPSGVWDTTYVTTFTVSNMCGTAKYDTTITVYSVPKVSFALMHEWECAPVALELQNTTTGNNCIFDWTFINKRTNETIYRSSVRNPQYEFDTDSASTTYYIRLRAENKCNEDTFTDSLVVKPRSISAHFTPLENPFACVNQEILFRNNSSDTVSTILNTYWNFGDGERTNEWSPSHKYDAAGTYLVSLKIDNGCGWDTISSSVNIYPLPTLKILSEDVLCEADTFTFVLKSDQELEHIEWKFGDGNRAYKDSLQYVYDGYGTFPVTVIGVSAEINQCTDSTWKEVVVNNKPIVTILPQDTMQCSPLLYAPQVTGDALLMWDYGDGTGQTSAQEHWYENPTDTVQKFQVKIYAETDKGCKSEYERHVAVYNNPRAALGKKVEKGNPQKVTFLNLSEEYTDCIWNLPFKGTLHSLDDQVVEFADNGTYTVGLIAENYYKCRDTTSLEHEVLIKGLYFPNTFIPHSLNGKINRFNGIGMGLLRYKLAIFDHYNNKIWETQALQDGKPSEGWDGCNLKGERMPQGLYIWRAEAIFGDDEVWTGKNNESGVPETTQGTVLLLRE